MVGRQWGRSAFALLTAFALVASPVLVGVAWAVDPPVAAISASPTGTTNIPVAFDGSGSTDDLNDIVSYTWDWGDATATGSGATADHTFSSSGT